MWQCLCFGVWQTLGKTVSSVWYGTHKEIQDNNTTDKNTGKQQYDIF
jgi:hypothetical protein